MYGNLLIAGGDFTSAGGAPAVHIAAWDGAGWSALGTGISGGFPGTESRSVMRFGGRYTHGPFRVDMAVGLGLTTVSPSLSFTAGFTYVFTAFTLTRLMVAWWVRWVRPQKLAIS